MERTKVEDIKREKVDSSNLESVGYDENSKVLEVEFKSGKVYRYLDVPKFKYVELVNANSKGKYFYSNIKNIYHCDLQVEGFSNLVGKRIPQIITRDAEGSEVVYFNSLKILLLDWAKIYKIDDGKTGVTRECRDTVSAFLKYLVSSDFDKKEVKEVVVEKKPVVEESVAHVSEIAK